MSKQLVEEMIRDLNQIEPNIYIKDRDMINGFVKKAAEENNVEFRTQKVKRMVKTELFLDEDYIGGYTGMKPSTTHSVAFHLCKDKYECEKFLRLMDIPTLGSKLFYEKQKEEAITYVRNFSKDRFVIKPLSLSGGRGIQFNVNTDNFSRSWDKSIEIQKEIKRKPYACIIQPFLVGFDIRVTIIEGVFSAALLRIPAHVVGDGQSSISALIEKKNQSRIKSEYFNNKLIEINDLLFQTLERQNLKLDSVVKRNQVVHLSHIGNLVAGADSFDITDSLSEALKDLAIKATAAIPGLYTSGVDIMTPDYTKAEGYIIEVNTNANNRMHQLPLKGKKQYPYTHYVESLILQHNILKNKPLNEEEVIFNNKIKSFLQLKNEYAIKYYEASTL